MRKKGAAEPRKIRWLEYAPSDDRIAGFGMDDVQRIRIFLSFLLGSCRKFGRGIVLAIRMQHLFDIGLIQTRGTGDGVKSFIIAENAPTLARIHLLLHYIRG